MKTRCIPVVPLLIVAAVLAMAGCRTAPVPPPKTASLEPPPAAPVSPEVALRDRVTRFWEARLKDDPATQYQLLEPEVTERVTLTAYVRSQGSFHFLSYKVQSINIVAEKAWVKVSYTFKMRIAQLVGFGPWTQESFEFWVLRDGVWYRPHNQNEARTPPPDVTKP